MHSSNQPETESRECRLEGKEDLIKKSYDELKKKNDEELDGYDDLRNLKVATFNHFLAKWENANEDRAKGEIVQLKNAFPVTLRGYFHDDIEKNKSALDW